jgi:hypothetical protein
MKYLPAILLCLLLIGCQAEPLATKVSDNPEVPYDYLFTIKEENIRVYRFMDGGHYCYISVKGGQTEVSFDIPKGKSKVPNTIQTIQKKDLEPK